MCSLYKREVLNSIIGWSAFDAPSASIGRTELSVMRDYYPRRVYCVLIANKSCHTLLASGRVFLTSRILARAQSFMLPFIICSGTNAESDRIPSQLIR